MGAHQQSDTGAAMLFVTLTDKQMTGANKGDAWDEKAEQQFAGILTALLKTGGLNVQAYRIGERKLLLSTMTGWYGRDVVEFCVEIKIYGAFVLNHRVVLHAIDATPARRRGGVNSSPLDRARTAAPDALVNFHTGRGDALRGHGLVLPSGGRVH